MNRPNTTIATLVAASVLTAVMAAAQVSTPPARAHSSMIFDPARGRVVLAGGGTKTADDRWITLGDVWSWDGTRWEASSIAGMTRSGHKLTYHASSSTLLAVGGNDNASTDPALLALDRDRWRPVSSDLLPARSEAAVAYDPVRKRVVVFGGVLNRTALGTTHEFDGTRWHAISVPGPAARHSAVMAFHPPTGRIVLSGGVGDNGKIFSDTWTWDGTSWTQVDSVGPGPLMGAAAATDEQRGEILLFGGVGPQGLSGATWAWNGTRWEERRGTGPTPRVVATMAYDPLRRVVVLFGGRMQGLRDSDETWEWDGERWSLRNASPSAGPDTIRIEVGSPAVNGSVYQPHRARVRVHLNSLDTPPTNEWTNELTIGDSAGRNVMRWVTLGRFDSTGSPGFDLRQTFDLVTLAPLGYKLKTRTGADISLAIDGTRMYGTRKLPNNPETQQVDQVIPRMGFIASASDLVPLAVGFSAGKVFIAPVWGPNMATAESHIFTIVGEESIVVEGKPVTAWKVEEYRESDRRLLSVWWVLDKSPYMVAGENYLANGDVQKMTEIELP